MKPVTAIIAYASGLSPKSLHDALIDSPSVDRVLVVKSEQTGLSQANGFEVISGSLSSGETLGRIIDRVATEYALLLTGSHPLSLYPSALETMIESIGSEQAGMVYGDFYDTEGHNKLYHPSMIIRQAASATPLTSALVPALFRFRSPKGRKAIANLPAVRYAGLYDLRLRVSVDYVYPSRGKSPLCRLGYREDALRLGPVFLRRS